MFAPSKNRQELSNTARQQIQSAFNGRIVEGALRALAYSDYDKNGAAFQEAYSQLTEQLTKIKGISFDESDTDQIKQVFFDMMSKLARSFHQSEGRDEIVDTYQERYNEAQKNATKSGKIASQTQTQYLEAETVLNSNEVTKALEEIIKKRNEQAAATQKATNAEEAYKAQNVPQTLQDAETELSKVETDYEQVSSATLQAAESQRTLDNSFDQLKNRITLLFSFTNVYQKVRQVIQQTFNDVRNIDKAFTEIAMVTSYSVQEMWGTYDQYAEIANELGQTTESVIRASGLYYQQGLETNEAISLATDTMKLATLAGLDFEQATSLMTAAIRGFHMEMDQGTHVTDVYSELAAKAAASVNDIAEAMSRTASIANSAGMSFENTSAMLTTMIEATQESPENLGTAMKTIIARFTELKENVSAADSEFDDLDLNKVDKALKSIGVSLKDTNGQFRNIDDVLLETSEKWDGLDRNTQRYIATIAAGSRQQSRFIALMENYDRTMELIETAQDSAGKSAEQFAKYQDSVENKVNRLKNSWEQLRLSFLQSDTYKAAIDGLNSVVKSISKINFKRLIVLTPILIPIIKSFTTSLIAGIQSSANNFSKAGQLISQSVAQGISSKFETFAKNFFGKNPVSKYLTVNPEDYQQNLLQIEALEKKSYQLRIEQADEYASQQAAWLNGDEEESRLRQANVEHIKNQVFQLDQLAQRKKEENKATEDFIKKQKQSQEITAGVARGLTVAAQSATVFASALISGADAGSAFKALMSSLLVQIVQVGIQLLSQGALYVASKGTEVAVTTAAEKAKTTTVLTESATRQAAYNAETTAAVGASIAASLATGAVLLVVAAIAGLGYGIYKIVEQYNNTHKTVEEQLADLQERIKEAEDRAEETQRQVDTEKESIKNAEELQKRYKELNAIAGKTTEEQEEYKQIVDEIREKFPEIVTYYNDVTGELVVQNDLWDAILQKQKEAYKDSIVENAIAQNAKTNLDIEEADKKREVDLENARRQSAEDFVIENNAYKGWTAQKFIARRLSENAQIESIVESLQNYGFDIESVADYLGYDLSNSNDTQKLLKDLAKGTDEVVKGLHDNYEALQNNTDSVDKEILAAKKRSQYAAVLEAEGYSEPVAQAIARNENRTVIDDSKTDFHENFGGNTESIEESLSRIVGGTAAAATIGAIGGPIGAAVTGGIALVGGSIEEVVQSSIKNNLIEYKDLDKDTKAILESMDISEEDYNDKRKTKKDYNALLENFESYAQEYYHIQSLQAQENLGFNESNLRKLGRENVTLKTVQDKSKQAQTELESFWAEIDNLTIEEIANKKEQLRNTFKGSELNDDVQTNIDEYIENLNNELIQLNDLFGLSTKTDETGKIKDATFDGLSANDRAAWQKIAEDNITNLGRASGESYNKALIEAWQSSERSSEEFLQAYNSIDWSKANSANFEDFKQSILNTFEELGIVGGEKLFNSLYKAAKNSNVYDDIIDTQAEVLTYENQLEGVLTAFNAQRDVLQEIQGIAKEGTEITLDDIDKLQGALDEINEATGLNYAAEDFYETVKDTVTGAEKIVFNQEKINKLINDGLYGESYIKKLEEDKAEILARQTIHQENGYAWGHLLTEEEQASVDAITALIEELKKRVDLTKKAAEEEERIAKSLDTQLDKISSLISSYQTAAKEQKENGRLSYSTYTSLQKSLEETLNKNGNKWFDISNYIDNNLHFSYEKLSQDIQKTIELWDKEGKSTTELQFLLWDLVDANNALAETEDKVSTAWDAYQDKLEAEAKARETLTEKIEAQAEAERKLQEVYYGTENHKNQTDPLYNYQTQRTQLQDRQNRAKDNIENATSRDDIRNYVNDYFQSTHDEIVNLQAQNELINQHINNQKEILDTKLSSELARLKAEGAVDMSLNVADFYEEIDGRWYIDYDRLNAANIPDDISDYIESVVEDMNKYAKSIEDNLDAIKAKEKELKDFQKKARDDYLNVVNKVADILKEKYQQEIDDVQDKYTAIKEADDDYLDALEEAINKQRELRNKASQWDDLAKQEKKLSLKMRDTSGANAKEIQKLQEDTQKKREELLDNTVDDIVKGLKEVYEEQQETRDAEIEYRQAVLDNKNLIEEATAIVDNWGSVEDVYAFFAAMDKEFINSSELVKEKMKEEYEEYYNTSVLYHEARLMDIETFTQTSADEVQHLTQTMSETMTTEADRAMNEVTTKVDETINSAKDAVTDAINAVAQAQQDLTKAIQESTTAWNEYATAAAAAAEAGKTVEGTGIPGGNEPPDIDNSFGQLGWNHTGLKIVTDAFVNAAKAQGYHGYYNDSDVYLYGKDILPSSMEASVRSKGYQVFKTGGLVDYTGPAWVDGTPTQPEAFLNYEDTRNIGQLTDVLRELRIKEALQVVNDWQPNKDIGDTHIEININIENVSSDYDVDQAVERVRQDIVDIATQAGSTVILHK